MPPEPDWVDQVISDLFDIPEERLGPWEQDFFPSIVTQRARGFFLTERQYAALRKMYGRHYTERYPRLKDYQPFPPEDLPPLLRERRNPPKNTP